MVHVAFAPLVGCRDESDVIREQGVRAPDLRRRGAAVEALLRSPVLPALAEAMPHRLVQFVEEQSGASTHDRLPDWLEAVLPTDAQD